MVNITVRYDGTLRCEARHGPSQAAVTTDAPVDNHGRGESYSPTDLVATAFATCTMTIMGIVAERDGIDLTGMTASVQKVMVTEPARRIGALPLLITVPVALTAAQRHKLEQAARSCPVALSINPAIDAPITFEYTAAPS